MILLVLAGLAADGSDARAYARAVGAATDDVRIYDGWYTALLARGTVVNPALVAWQRERLASLGAQAPAPEPGFVVVVSANSDYTEELSVAADGSSYWSAQLMTGSRACAPPLRVEETKEASSVQRILYPHITQWDRVFTFHYAPDACGGEPPRSMRLKSARGSGELRWAD